MTTAQMKMKTLKILLESMKLQPGPQILTTCVSGLGTAIKMRTPSAFPVTQVRYYLKLFSWSLTDFFQVQRHLIHSASKRCQSEKVP